MIVKIKIDKIKAKGITIASRSNLDYQHVVL